MRQMTYDEAAALKAAVAGQFGAAVHFHDACGGQSFSLDAADAAVQEFIAAYCAARGLSASFSADGRSFVVGAGGAR